MTTLGALVSVVVRTIQDHANDPEKFHSVSVHPIVGELIAGHAVSNGVYLGGGLYICNLQVFCDAPEGELVFWKRRPEARLAVSTPVYKKLF